MKIIGLVCLCFILFMGNVNAETYTAKTKADVVSNLEIDVLLWMVVRYSKILITSAARDEDSGCHGTTPLRAFDLRSSVFEDPQGIVDDINVHWEYDLKRPGKYKVAAYHEVFKDGKSLGKHIHIQVHSNTRFRK